MAAAYAVLELTGRVASGQSRAKSIWLGAGAIAAGGCIWATHFIGTLAYSLPVPVLYHYPTLGWSLLAGIAATAVMLYTASREKISLASVALGSLMMTVGFCAMHYLRMEALRLPAVLEYRRGVVAIFALSTIAISAGGVLLTFRTRQENAGWTKLMGALIVGSAIPLLHFAEVWAVRFRQSDIPFSTQATLHVSSIDTVVVSMTSFLLAFAATFTAIQDRLLSAQIAIAAAAHDGETQFRTMAEAIPQIVWTAGPDGLTNYINQRWYEMTGMTTGEGLGASWTQSVHPDDRDVCQRKWQECMRDGKTFEIEYRLHDAKKGYCWYLDRAVPMRDSSGEIRQWFGTCTDIDDQMRNQQLLEEQIKAHTAALMDANDKLETEMRERALAQQELNQQNERMLRELTLRSNRATTLARMAELLQSCIELKDILSVIAGMAPKIFPELRGAVLLFNSARDALEVVSSWADCQFPASVFNPQDCWALRMGHAHSVTSGDPTAPCLHVPPGEYSYFCLPLLSQGASIGILHFQKIGSPDVPDSTMNIANMFAEQVGLSVSNLRLREALRNQSIRDPLTGLFNRRYLEETLEREIRRAVRSEQSLGLMMLDLDHFKSFNDTYGHDAGDTVLRETGAFLSKSVRAEDIVCRFGGEEFVVILPMANLQATHVRAERIRTKLRELAVLHQGQSLGMITASLGVAALPDHGTARGPLLEAADAALYRAKREGRDRVVVAGLPSAAMTKSTADELRASKV